ncbi:protein of unknown function [Agrobacterium pusense]|uniref:Uncharacterized protein n=1 Tax=Agrobacterium pusense TaxID=648995 RepID=U4Q1R7_9HYPH|nr:protein of unknown function [Agrobacterium pusense]
MPAIRKTSAPMNWREKAWSLSNGGNARLLYFAPDKIRAGTPPSGVVKTETRPILSSRGAPVVPNGGEKSG